MSTISFGGLASGLDTDAIIESLVNVKTAQLVTPLQTKVLNVQTKSTAVSSLKTAMTSLQATAETLQSATFSSRSTSSSDSSIVSITSSEDDAAEGDFLIYVDQMAQHDRNYFDGVADTDTTTFGTGTITITSNGVSKEVEIDSDNNTLDGIVEAINETSGIEVTASIINDGDATSPYRLLLTSTEKGTDSAITTDIASVLSLTAASATTTTLNAASENQGQDASIRVNSLTITSESNSFTDAIPGVTFEIEKVETTDPVTVSVEESLSSATSSIGSLISNYNSVQDFFAAQFDFDPDTGESGILSSDIGIQTAYKRLKTIMFDIYSQIGNTEYDSLTSLGITLNSSSQLEMDTDAFETAVSDNLTEVKRLFQGTDSENGLADALYDFLDSMTDNIDGILTEKVEIYDDTVEEINELIETRESRIETYEAQLQAKYAYMETYITTLQAQEKVLENFQDQLAGLNGAD